MKSRDLVHKTRRRCFKKGAPYECLRRLARLLRQRKIQHFRVHMLMIHPVNVD